MTDITETEHEVPEIVAAALKRIEEEPRCWGCKDVLAEDRKALGYCSKGCRRPAEIVAKSRAASAAGNHAEAMRLLGVADSMSTKIRADRSPSR